MSELNLLQQLFYLYGLCVLSAVLVGGPIFLVVWVKGKKKPTRTATVKEGVHNIGIVSGPGYPKFKIVGSLEEGQTYTMLGEKKGLDNDQPETFYRIGPNQWAAKKYLLISDAVVVKEETKAK